VSTITISLPEALKQFVEHEVNAGGYGNVSEYFRDLLREAQARIRRETLDARLLAGLSLPSGAADAEFWTRLRGEAKRLLRNGEADGAGNWPVALGPHREAIEALCRNFAVREFALLGASARDTVNAGTEPLECAVHLGDQRGDELATAYAKFSASLAALLERPIDLIEIGSMGPTRLRRLIEQTRRVLYVAAASD
jgi:antitoxin ParD1/3/4